MYFPLFRCILLSSVIANALNVCSTLYKENSHVARSSVDEAISATGKRLFRRVGPGEALLGQTRERSESSEHEEENPRRMRTNSVATQTDTHHTQSVHDRLRFEGLRDLHRQPHDVQIPIMKEVYLYRLAQVYWENNHKVLQSWFRGRARDDWQDRHWWESEPELHQILTAVQARVMPAAEPHLRDLERQATETRNARPERIRHQDTLNLQKSGALNRAIKATENAIYLAATAAIEPLLRAHGRTLSRDPEWLERNDRFIEKHAWTWRREVPGRYPPFEEEPQTLRDWISLYSLWRYPMTLAEMRRCIAGQLDNHVKRVLLQMHWSVDDRHRLGPRMLLAAVRPWIAEIDRSVAVGMQRVVANPGTDAIGAAKAWMAFLYGWGRYPDSCLRAGIPQNIRPEPGPANERLGNVAVRPPPVPPLLVQGRPPPPVQGRPPPPRTAVATTQTTAPLERSKSI